MIFVFDMDNTLSYGVDRLYKHPLHLNPKDRKNKDTSTLWKEYYQGCSEDKPVDGILKLLHILQEIPNVKIIILTARDENARQETEIWLKKHNVKYTEIYMRQINQCKKAALVKKDCILEIQKKYGQITLIFEDDIRNIKMFQELQIPVIKPDTLSLIDIIEKI